MTDATCNNRAIDRIALRGITTVFILSIRANIFVISTINNFFYGHSEINKNHHFVYSTDFTWSALPINNRILSINCCVFLYTLKQISIKNNTISIPSPMGEFERGKIIPPISQITLSLLVIRFQDCIIVIMVMSPVSRPLTPRNREYFQLPNRSIYKVCNRYKISDITLESFGLIIDQGKRELPKVMESDSMLSNPENDKKVDADKPFCCTHCGSENYIKYGKKNNKQVYKCKDCNRKFFDNLLYSLSNDIEN